MKIDSNKLKGAVQIISAVNANPAIPSSVLARAALKGTSMRLSLASDAIASASVPVAGNSKEIVLYLDRKALQAFAENASSDVTLELVDSSATLKSGRQKVIIPFGDETKGYSSWKKDGASKAVIPEYVVGILPLLSKYAAAGPPSEYVSNVLMVEKYGIMSTNMLIMLVVLDKGIKQRLQIPPLVAATVNDSSEVLTDKQGAGIVYSSGYIYQPFMATTQPYPVAELQRLVESCQKHKPDITFTASELKSGLAYLSKFGPPDKIKVQAVKGKSVRLQSDLIIGGEVHTSVKATVARDLEVEWEDDEGKGKIGAFVDSLSNEAEIIYVETEQVHGFLTTVADHPAILAVAKAS